MEYTVQPGDSLVQIAVKNDTSVSYLKEINNLYQDYIFPGDKIIIEKPESGHHMMIRKHVSLEKGEVEIPGILTFSDAKIEFIPDDKDIENTVRIRTRDYSESTLIPHPSVVFTGPNCDKTCNNSPFLLVVSYVNGRELVPVVFTGKKCELQCFSECLLSLKKSVSECFSTKSISMPDLSSLGQPKKRALLPIKMIGCSQSTLLNQDEILKLRDEMPKRYRNSNWRSLYQMNIHGCAYSTFYQQTSNFEPIVLIVKTDGGERIGGFISRGLKQSKQYYGSGESFVFTLKNGVHVYHWSKKNDYFITSSDNEIAIGGGGSAALWIGGDMDRAMSEKCETFASPQLTEEMEFRIINLEAWTLQESHL